ncbi:hypothetical protein QBC34DRAFT_417151 [Podospora aff. communis PSN243]|uniref:Uncharacterized protein n=1 Tax=Podospora aff. communis PSN243 TaxID=3040156 RepID=A0AAV9G3V1_9PEZI|nr:hypothetical protein QBC34DRAFT_417151 [Podospora aff. communis PSN243]
MDQILIGPPPGSDSTVFNIVFEVPHRSSTIKAEVKECPGEVPRGRFLRRIFSEVQRPPAEADERPAGGFRTAAMQWRNGDKHATPWYRLVGYDFFFTLDQAQESSGIARMVKQLGGGGEKKSIKCAQTVRKLRLVEDGDFGGGGAKALILCETHLFHLAKDPLSGLMSWLFGLGGWSKLDPRSALMSWLFDLGGWPKLERELSFPLGPTGTFLLELNRLHETYYPLRTGANLKQIFLLQVHHAHLNHYAGFLDRFEDEYTNQRARLFDPSHSQLRQWNLQAIMADAQLYRCFNSAASELTLATESLLDTVLALEEGDDGRTELALLGAELRGCCKDIIHRVTRMSDDLEHQLKMLGLLKDMNQSQNVTILTILATVFLPLSLSAGVLSMQTRFQDLGDLLYDFFGVVILLATIIGVLLVGMVALSYGREWESVLVQRYKWYRSFGRLAVLCVAAVIGLVFGALVLTSFLVGMFKDVTLGAKILGFGVLVAVGVPISLYILGMLYAEVVEPVLELIPKRRKSDDAGKEKGKDPESAAGESKA